ncbi:hypothetical protein, conserved [Eimeria praecox]|uniref:Uncharacterized protein n=1 Tax=Eimeria praecox TaxID=51316 RepID=U6H332_9EIME|nr:hypothetical protein, conserved [Eimeria praecox]
MRPFVGGPPTLLLASKGVSSLTVSQHRFLASVPFRAAAGAPLNGGAPGAPPSSGGSPGGPSPPLADCSEGPQGPPLSAAEGWEEVGDSLEEQHHLFGDKFVEAPVPLDEYGSPSYRPPVKVELRRGPQGAPREAPLGAPRGAPRGAPSVGERRQFDPLSEDLDLDIMPSGGPPERGPPKGPPEGPLGGPRGAVTTAEGAELIETESPIAKATHAARMPRAVWERLSPQHLHTQQQLIRARTPEAILEIVAAAAETVGGTGYGGAPVLQQQQDRQTQQQEQQQKQQQHVLQQQLGCRRCLAWMLSTL